MTTRSFVSPTGWHEREVLKTENALNTGRMMNRPVYILLTASMVVGLVSIRAGLGQESQTPSGLRVLLMGIVDRHINPLSDWLSQEPGTVFSVVPSRLVKESWSDSHGEAFQDEIRRFIRIYFPRSVDELQDYDVILFSSILVTMYTGQQIEWMVEAIRDGGACAIADTGGMMGKNPLMYLPWAESTVSEAFPCDADKTSSVFGLAEAPNLGQFRVRLNRNASDPVFTPFLAFGIENWRGTSGRIMIPQLGSTTWGWMHLASEDHPWVLSWSYGEGLTWSVGDAPRYPFWSNYEVGWSDNEFGMDMWFNMMFFGTGRELVADVPLVHRARDSFGLYRMQVETTMDFLEFVERFGANAQPLVLEIAGLEGLRERARQHYIEQDYESAASKMEEAMQELLAISERGVKLRMRALTWVYVTEWTAVTGVGIISGVTLHSLMIKRRLYRETGTTRYEA